MRFWESITAFGDSGVLLPAAALISLWLVSARQARLAARWCLTVAFVGTTVALSKLLFMGWCLGLRSLDFTGLSGHAAMAGVVLPVLFHLGPMAFRGHRQKGSWLIGTCVAGLIGMSRLALHVHSVSEVVGGLAFGLGCGAVFLHRADRSGKIAIGPQLATIPLLILPGLLWLQPAPTQWLLEEIAILVSGQHAAYTRRHDACESVDWQTQHRPPLEPMAAGEAKTHSKNTRGLMPLLG